MKTTLSINASKARELYNTGCEAVKTILEESFGKDFCKRGFCEMDIRERVKTYEDACKSMAMDINIIENQNAILIKSGYRPLEPHVIAYIKLCTIIEALNEGWEPDWNNGIEGKWRPWFDMAPFTFVRSYCDYLFASAGGRVSPLSEKQRTIWLLRRAVP